MDIKIFTPFKFRPKRKEDYIFYIFLLFFTSYVIFLSHKLVIWEDEAFALNTSSQSLFETLRLSYNFEGQPPVYFLILNFWLKLNNSLFFSRLLSVIFILLSAFFIHKLGKLIFEKVYTKWVIVLFLLNPFSLWAATETRLYSWLIFLSVVTIYLFYQIYFYNYTKRRLIFLIAGLLGIYTQYYFTLLIAALAIVLLISKGWRPFLSYCLLGSILFVLFIPNLLIIPEQFRMHENINSPVYRSFLGWVGCIFFSPFQMLFGIQQTGIDLTGRWLVLFSSFVLILILAYKFYQKSKVDKNIGINTIFQISIPIFLVLTFFLIVFLNSGLYYTHRYMTILFPFYGILFSIIGILTSKFRCTLYLGITLYYVLHAYYLYSPPFLKLYNNKAAAEYIQQIESKNEPVFFRHTSILLGFKHYYHGKNSLIHLPERKFDFNYYHYQLRDTVELKAILERNMNNNKSFFLINQEDNTIPNSFLTNSKLDSYLGKKYIVSKDTIIPGNDDYYLRIRKLNNR